MLLQDQHLAKLRLRLLEGITRISVDLSYLLLILMYLNCFHYILISEIENRKVNRKKQKGQFIKYNA